MKILTEMRGWGMVAICGLMFIAAQSFAATYYVDASLGHDARDGQSAANAWKTVAKVNASTFAAGDTIYFKRGEVWRGTTLKLQSSGFDGSPITLGAYGDAPELPKITAASLIDPRQWKKESNGEYSLTGTFTGRIVFIEDGRRLTGNNVLGTLPGPMQRSLMPGQWAWDGVSNIYYKPSSVGTTPADHVVEVLDGWKVSFDTNNQRFVVVQDLEFYAGFQQIAYVQGANITLRNCKIHSGYRGLEVQLSQNILIENNEVYDINWKGIAIMNGTSAAVVRGNHVHDIGRLDVDDGDLEGILVGGGVNQARPWDAVIENNLVEYIGRDWYNGKDGTDSVGTLGSTGIALDAVRQVVVRNNTIRWCWRNGIQIIASSAVTEDIKVFGNVIHDVGHTTSLNWINDGIAVMSTQGFAISRVNIFNNTIADSTFKSDVNKNEGAFRVTVNDKLYPKKIGSQVSDVTFVNNIVANVIGDYAISVDSSKSNGIVNLISDFNIIEKETGPVVYWKPNGVTAMVFPDLASYISETGQDSHSYTNDPAFLDPPASDFHLTAGSIAKDAGTVTDRSTDHDGMQIVGVPDIGAYEFQQAPVSQPDYADGYTFTSMPAVLTGFASDDVSVARVDIAIKDINSGLWLQEDGSFGPKYKRIAISLGTPNQPDTAWNYTVTLPNGHYGYHTIAVDNIGLETPQAQRVWRQLTVQQSTVNQAPVSQPDYANGYTFTSVPVVLTGSASDDVSVARVDIAIKDINSGLWLQEDGGFGAKYKRIAISLGAPNEASSAWNYTVTLPNGYYGYHTIAVDNVGLETPQALRVWRQFTVQ
jgi:hypothetical protein